MDADSSGVAPQCSMQRKNNELCMKGLRIEESACIFPVTFAIPSRKCDALSRVFAYMAYTASRACTLFGDRALRH